MFDRADAGWSRWRLAAGLAGLAVIVQLWGLYRVPGPPTAPWFPHTDKLQHALGFASPVTLLLLALGLLAGERSDRLSRRALGLVVAVFTVHAVASEIVQHRFYASRTGDPLDVLADLVGVAAGTALALVLLRRAAARVLSPRTAWPSRAVAR
jgi:VanZ family protein